LFTIEIFTVFDGKDSLGRACLKRVSKIQQAYRSLTSPEVAQVTDTHRTTLSKMVDVRGYNATLLNIDPLRKFFGCGVDDLAT